MTQWFVEKNAIASEVYDSANNNDGQRTNIDKKISLSHWLR